MLADVWTYLNSEQLNGQVTWAVIYSLAPLCFLTALFMLKIGPRFLLDWAYAWLMVTLGLVVMRVIYSVKFAPQQLGSSIFGTLIWLNLFIAILFTLSVLAHTALGMWRQEREAAQ